MFIGIALSLVSIRGGADIPPASGDLQIDGFAILIDTFPIVFS